MLNMFFFAGATYIYVILIVAFAFLLRSIVIVPEKNVYIIERLGKYKKKCEAGLNFKIPLLDRVAYKLSLKEEALDVRPQVCITSDNVQVRVDGILYLKVFDAVKACYGIDNYHFAVSQLAQTTMRSEIGKMELDKTFSGREALNTNIVKALETASSGWGIQVNRYEIRDITPSETILTAMESQMRAEREKRADILLSEGKKQARINISLGQKEKAINEAKGEKEKKIMIAEGKSKAIQMKGYATSQGLMLVSQALKSSKGDKAKKLRLTENYIKTLEEILKKGHVSVYPEALDAIASISDIVKKVGVKC